ncbi:hypothetical protein [Ornithinimicrobium sp. Y1694]|uniref:hypothetical protein n=1 Tax=Ornithinimicrobium sp. Y1694 TaxID=3418590 RepID=UPI003CF4E6A8
MPPYTRWINRPLGLIAARVALHLGLSPSAVSMVGFVLGLAGLSLLLAGPSTR